MTHIPLYRCTVCGYFGTEQDHRVPGHDRICFYFARLVRAPAKDQTVTSK